MKTKLLFESWRKFVNEEHLGDETSCEECTDMCLSAGNSIAECRKECADGGYCDDKKVNEAYDEEEYATAAGMQQGLDMRKERGDFEQGDWGVHGDLGYSDQGGMAGEYSDYAEYPWIKDALENLQDEEFDDKVKALESLADELGIEITTSEEAEEEEDLNEQ